MVITACGLMLASTIQFSHNTPHQPHNRQQKLLQTGYMRFAWVDNQGIMPQTPNNAPKYLKQKLCVGRLKSLVKVYLHPIHSWWQQNFCLLNHQAHEKYSRAYNTNWCLILMLLRKEVIHPHLPVRVPCYDFVPIADPTLDSSLTSLSHWLRVLPTFMT